MFSKQLRKQRTSYSIRDYKFYVDLPSCVRLFLKKESSYNIGMDKNVLHAIFFDSFNHWDTLVEKHGERIRPVVLDEVNKFRHCGEIVRGFQLFVCEGCHDVKKVPFRCKGKFCPTCAVGETQRWSELVAQDMYKILHAKRMTRGKSWRELTIEQFKKNPLECPYCGNCYVFKGTVVRKNGKLKVGYANGKEAHVYLVKEIGRLEEEAYQYEQKEAEETLFKAIRFDWDTLYRSINERERELYLSIL